MTKKSIKIRPVTKHFMTKENERVILEPFYCIEVCQGRKWGLLGGSFGDANQTGVYKFKTAQERDNKILELKSKIDA